MGSQSAHDEASDPAKFLSQLKLPYQDFYKDFSDSVSGKGQMTSFEEQKSFHKIFNYLKNEHGSIGITDTVKKITGFSDLTVNQLLGNEESRLASEKSSAIKKRFDDKLKHNREIMESLLPTLEYINNEINDSEQLSEFVRSEVLERFLQADKSELLKKHSLSEISKKSMEDASKPLVDKETLPILLRFCLNSMTNDFNSFDETMLIINYIKRHQSIELYEFGLNIDVYNSLLEQIWSKTENLQLISAVVDELKVNAIQPDMMTYKILAQVYLTCMRIKDEVKAEPYLLWGESGDIYKVKDFIGGIKTIH
ncbi:DEKNAAC104089 [Brettanomyces naardenensis]|uniref:DEKNAAC104089 n=1 Tax=Brettanomyces naardenensis TaxID=13370 RepID=A0A448YPT7_BRENA|nr:DEKNAAC104089 [Brettanomyces naardenensis]